MDVIRFMTSFILVFVGAYSAMVGALYLFQRNLIYYPDPSAPTPAASGLPEMQTVPLTTADGLTLLAWYRQAEEGMPTLVYFHGNAGNIGSRGAKARPYLGAGFGLLLAPYRGYSGNPGKPTEDGLYADGRAALAFLKIEGVAAGLTVLYGESLGSGIAVQMAFEMARDSPAGAVVLEAPYTSIADVAAHHYPLVPARWLVKDRFDAVANITAIKAPLLIFHGGRDETVPTVFGRHLFEAAAEPKEGRWLAAADHNNLYDHGAAGMVIDFLARRFGLGRAGEKGAPGSG